MSEHIARAAADGALQGEHLQRMEKWCIEGAARVQSAQRERRRESAAELGEHLRCRQCVVAAAAGALACAAAVSSAAATWSLVAAPLPPPPLPPPAACWETMLGDL